MARKKSTNRPNLPTETLDRARREVGGEVIMPSPRKQKSVAAKADTVKRVTMEDLAREYSYVVTDLRNMGLLALALFVLLVVMALVG